MTKTRFKLTLILYGQNSGVENLVGTVYVWIKKGESTISHIPEGEPVYVGYTTRPLEKRSGLHVSRALRGEGFILGAAIRKYGVDAFQVVPQLICEDIDTLRDYEKYLIKVLHPRYNLTTGGEGGHRSERPKAQVKAPSKGRVISDEARSRMAAAKRGKPVSMETRKKMSDAHRTEPLTNELAAKLPPSSRAYKRYLADLERRIAELEEKLK